MVKIVAKHISKLFKKGKVIALEDVNIVIENGERFGILGPSGAGKTTFMRIIAGLDVPSSGELYFDDKLVASNGKLVVPPEDRKIGMVFQTWALYPNLTAFENIAFPLTNMKMSKEEIRKRVEEVAKILDIHHVLNHFPRELSGGQQQRVALARALVKDPSLLLLDEPFSNLDARMRDSARALVKEVQSRLGVTLLVVSHGSFRFPVSVSSDKVLIGIRPEDVKISKDVIRDDSWTLVGKGRVKVIGYQGGLFRITITPLNSEEEIFTYSDHPMHSGEEVLVYVKKDKIKVFEKN
ncbi:MAG: ABC transporter ATP-binding protein [Saccharolobus sp.]|uniref:ABC transporter ATP-binding protein n=1 Tax=Saccharolobus TaxID=2100760 RepID=UPI001F0D90E7|nr:ABC transporter ATP-binding protein [Saccharolobus shibatae]MCH4816604.1 ABC transporter ATP-binding protein [Saccharolobus shibatae]